MSKIVKSSELNGLFAQSGITSEEDQEAIRSAVDQGVSFAAAAADLGYGKAAITTTKKGKAIASPTVKTPEQAFVDTGAVVDIQEDAYETGRQVIRGARVVRRENFAKGVEDELSQGAEEDQQFFRETANAGIAALRFRPGQPS